VTKLRKLRGVPAGITNYPQFAGIYPEPKFLRFPGIVVARGGGVRFDAGLEG
jgi:hypothetical protein